MGVHEACKDQWGRWPEINDKDDMGTKGGDGYKKSVTRSDIRISSSHGTLEGLI